MNWLQAGFIALGVLWVAGVVFAIWAADQDVKLWPPNGPGS